jgi:hypothetical protein
MTTEDKRIMAMANRGTMAGRPLALIKMIKEEKGTKGMAGH